MEGIGTDRYVGYGFFETIKDENEMVIEVPDDAHHRVALSMFIPESEEQLNGVLGDDKVAYDFTRRGGWITTAPYNTLRKNAIYAFLPGSVFCRTSDENCLGRIADLKPEGEVGGQIVSHPIWRNGKSIMLPIKL
jgi:CRISPR type III-A-associated RAMP protein Csm4